MVLFVIFMMCAAINIGFDVHNGNWSSVGGWFCAALYCYGFNMALGTF